MMNEQKILKIYFKMDRPQPKLQCIYTSTPRAPSIQIARPKKLRSASQVQQSELQLCLQSLKKGKEGKEKRKKKPLPFTNIICKMRRKERSTPAPLRLPCPFAAYLGPPSTPIGGNGKVSSIPAKCSCHVKTTVIAVVRIKFWFGKKSNLKRCLEISNVSCVDLTRYSTYVRTYVRSLGYYYDPTRQMPLPCAAIRFSTNNIYLFLRAVLFNIVFFSQTRGPTSDCFADKREDEEEVPPPVIDIAPTSMFIHTYSATEAVTAIPFFFK